MHFHRKAVLGLAATAALTAGFAANAHAQAWQTAVAQGTYAVYSINREVAGVPTQAEYFIQTFGDGTVAITNHVLKNLPAQEGAPNLALTESLCQGTYLPNLEGLQHQATCGDETFDLLILATEVVDGVLVATEMRGVNRTRGTDDGGVLVYSYRRLADGWENAVLLGNYVAYDDFRDDDPPGYRLSTFFLGTWTADSRPRLHHLIANAAGAEPETRQITDILDWVTNRDYIPNGIFPGIHLAINSENGVPSWHWLVLGVEEIGGVMVVTEMRGFALGAGSLGQWHFHRRGD